MRSARGATGRTAGQTAGGLVYELRLAAALSTCQLARRSATSCSTVSRLETGRIRPRRSLLSAVALGLDPDRQQEILTALVEAAGGEDALAEDGRWPSFRRRRIERGIAAATVPLPSRIARSVDLHRQAGELWAAALALLDQPGAMADTAMLTRADQLLRESHRLSDEAGPPIAVYVGGKRISAGCGAP